MVDEEKWINNVIKLGDDGGGKNGEKKVKREVERMKMKGFEGDEI